MDLWVDLFILRIKEWISWFGSIITKYKENTLNKVHAGIFPIGLWAKIFSRNENKNMQNSTSSIIFHSKN